MSNVRRILDVGALLVAAAVVWLVARAPAEVGEPAIALAAALLVFATTTAPSRLRRRVVRSTLTTTLITAATTWVCVVGFALMSTPEVEWIPVIVRDGWGVASGEFSPTASPGGPTSFASARERAAAAVPGAHVGFVGELGRDIGGVNATVFPSAGCSVDEAAAARPTPKRCDVPGWTSPRPYPPPKDDEPPELRIVSPEDAGALFGAGAEGQAALAAGGIVVPQALPHGRTEVTAAQGVLEYDRGMRTGLRPKHQAVLPVTVEPHMRGLRDDTAKDAVIGPAGVARFGGRVTWVHMVVVPTSGAISGEQGTRLEAEMRSTGVEGYVQCDPPARSPWMLGSVLAAALLLTVGLRGAVVARRLGMADSTRRRRAVTAGGWTAAGAVGGLLVGTAWAPDPLPRGSEGVDTAAGFVWLPWSWLALAAVGVATAAVLGAVVAQLRWRPDPAPTVTTDDSEDVQAAV